MSAAYDIFISYKHGRSEISTWRDRVSGQNLAVDLKARLLAQARRASVPPPGIFLDIHEIGPGAGWQAPAQDAIRECQVFARIAGPAFFKSVNCRLEEKSFIENARAEMEEWSERRKRVRLFDKYQYFLISG